MSHSFDALVLLTSIPSETSFLWKYKIHLISNIHLKIFCIEFIFHANLFLKMYYSSTHF